jgi:hypothetical protein
VSRNVLQTAVFTGKLLSAKKSESEGFSLQIFFLPAQIHNSITAFPNTLPEAHHHNRKTERQRQIERRKGVKKKKN